MRIRLTLLTLATCLTSRAHAQHLAVARSGITLPSHSAGAPLGLTPAPAGRAASKAARVALQLLASSAGAIGGGFAAFVVTQDLSETRQSGDEGYTRSGNIGYLAGSLAGATAGAHLVGNAMGGKSHVAATAIGALIGTAPIAALGIDEPYLPLFGILLGWIPQALLATGGYAVGASR